MFRALGGEEGVQVAGAKSRKSGHRLRWRQHIGLVDESIDHPGRDGATVFLPDRIALFPDRKLNAMLYRWLAAWFATAPVAASDEIDPLRRDIMTLRRARETVGRVHALPWPGTPLRACSLRPRRLHARAGRCRGPSGKSSGSRWRCSVPPRLWKAGYGRP